MLFGGFWTVSVFSFIMAGRLLSVILVYSFHEFQAQALLPPKLTVSLPVITETDSVTLNCQTPSSVSVRQCYFYTLSGGTVREFSCLQTLTGTELLKMAHLSSPAEVKVMCFYTVKLEELNSPSPHSDTSSITVQSLLPPKLTVSLPVITETDSVTLNCQTPSSVSVRQCYFYTLNGRTVREFSCLQTLTGTELLKMAHLSSPAEVKVTCAYSVKHGESNSQSPYSNASSITVHTLLPPKLTVTPYSDVSSITVHSLTVSRPHASSLVTPVKLTSGLTVSRPRASSLVTPVKLTSGWTGGTPSNTGGSTSTSRTPVKPASETDSGMTPVNPESGDEITETDSGMTPVNPESGDEITGLSVSTPGTKDSSFPVTSTKTASAKTWTWKFVVVVAGCGVTVGVILLVSAILCYKKRAVGSEEVKKREPQNENFDTYHLYSTISEEPASSALKDIVYSTTQRH